MFQSEFNEIGQFIPLHYHFQMLSDKSRMTAFRAAIEQTVKPFHKVVELGSGTGVLSSFAAKQGAEVWSVEFNPSLVAASRKYISENGLSNNIHVLHADASNWLPQEPVDLVICEMLHSALLREKQVHVISAFREAHFQRFGKTPRLLPNATLLAVQPVQQSYDFEGYYAPVPFFQSAYTLNDDCTPCCDPKVYKIVDYDNANVETYNADLVFTFEREMDVNALRFITKSLLTMNMSNGKTVDWHSQHIVLPLHQPLHVCAGQTMLVHFSYRPGDPIEKLNNTIVADVAKADEKSITLIA